MDVDKIFKLPKLPQSSVNKRKWTEPNADALKAAKVEDVEDQDKGKEAEPVAGPSRSSTRAARVNDEGDEEGDSDFAPGNDADYFVDEDDEGGRFFGGGLTDQQKRILEIMNRDAEEGKEEKDRPEKELAELRKTLLKFERTINKNQEMRVRFADDPSKFIDSEADLDVSLKSLLVLTTNPAFFYPETIKHGTPASLCGLLSHENVDIVASVIEVVEELTDEDVLDAGDEGREDAEVEDAEAGGTSRKGLEGMNMLVDSLLENSFVDLLVENLSRLNDHLPTREESNRDNAAAASNAESDASAVFHLLGVVENLVSFRPVLAKTFLMDTKLLDWLMGRIKRKGPHDQNRGYAGELLAILLQSQAGSEMTILNQKICEYFGNKDGIDSLLGILAPYRKREPADADELEFMENIFDALCAALTVPINKQRFHDGEGTELMCILMKEKRVARLRAIKVLDHALSGPFGAPNASRFVEGLGLKTLFGVFMGRGGVSSKGDASVLPTSADEEHVLGILVSLLNHLPSDSKERIRVLAKFVENDYEKLDRLLEIRDTCLRRLQMVEKEIEEEKRELGMEEEDEGIFYLRRLESGLFSLQMADYILAWLCMEDDGILGHAKKMLSRKGATLDNVIDILKEYYHNVGDDAIIAEGSAEKKATEHMSNGKTTEEKQEGTKDQDDCLRLKDVIVQLVNYLLSAL